MPRITTKASPTRRAGGTTTTTLRHHPSPRDPAATRLRTTLKVIATILAPTLLAGCAIFTEPSLDMYVYFDNTTDQTLQLRARNLQPGEDRDWYLEIAPSGRGGIPLLSRDQCSDHWVITDEDRHLVKDPGRICWHDTVTIP